MGSDNTGALDQLESHPLDLPFAFYIEGFFGVGKR